MMKSILSRATRLALTLALVLTLLAQPSLASCYFYGIVYSFGKKPRSAFMDVSVDPIITSQVEVPFVVFGEEGQVLAQFSSLINQDGFASTASFGNLFDISGGRPMLIRARTPNGNPSCAATLHIDSQGAPMTLSLPSIFKPDGTTLAGGTHFAIALGNFRSASLLIANVSANDIGVDVHKGSPDAAGRGVYSTPRLSANGIWRVDLTQNEALSNLVVVSSDIVIVQVVVDYGSGIQSFVVLPYS